VFFVCNTYFSCSMVRRIRWNHLQALAVVLFLLFRFFGVYLSKVMR